MVELKQKILKLGKILKSFRKNSGYTQPQLSSQSGVATSIVNDLENGIRTAGIKTIDKIARGLELNDDDRFRLLLIGLNFQKEILSFQTSLTILQKLLISYPICSINLVLIQVK